MHYGKWRERRKTYNNSTVHYTIIMVSDLTDIVAIQTGVIIATTDMSKYSLSLCVTYQAITNSKTDRGSQ